MASAALKWPVCCMYVVTRCPAKATACVYTGSACASPIAVLPGHQVRSSSPDRAWWNGCMGGQHAHRQGTMRNFPERGS
jgi:hypothetical protein